MDNYEIRKVQELTDGKSIMITLPKRYCKQLGIIKGSYARIYMKPGNNKEIFIEKAPL